MEFCITCGGIIPDDAIFCPNCGAPGTKYRLEHGDTPPAAAEPEASPSDAAGETDDYSFGAEAERTAPQEQPAQEAEAERNLTVAQRRNERILNEEKNKAPQRADAFTEDTNKSAITGFVFSLLPIPFFLSPIIGLIISAAAHRRAKSGAYRNDLCTLAIAGKVISIVRIVLNVLLIGLAVAAVLTLSYMHNNGLELNINELLGI